MATLQKFEDMEAWRTARELTRLIYSVTNTGAFARDFGLRDQLRRASVSVMSNIAEGFDSRTQALFIDFLGRARASAGEVRAQLYVALDVSYVEPAQFQQLSKLAESCSHQLSGLIVYLEHQPNSRRLREQQIIYDLGQFDAAISNQQSAISNQDPL